MPDAALFTPAFVGAFVVRCHEEGLTKEAATCLLELAALRAAHANPGFAAGFNERMSEGGLEKCAWARAGKLLAGGAVLGGIGLGAHHALKPKPDYMLGDVPLYGVYDQNAAAASENQRLAMASKGVARLNANVDRDGKRLYELQRVVDSGGPGAAAAIAELQQLRDSPYANHRDRYDQDLTRFNSGANAGLGTASANINKLNASRGSWWNRTRNFFGFPRDFDSEERRLVAQKARFAEQARLSQQLRDRLRSGATSFSNGVPTNEDMQQRFFPTQ